jgi:hypothetical protein
MEVVLVLLINRIKIVEVILLLVVIVKNALGVFFHPGFFIVEFMIEQMVVLGLRNIDLVTHLHFLRWLNCKGHLYRRALLLSQYSDALGRRLISCFHYFSH